MVIIRIQAGKNSINLNSNVKVQSLPCKIHADCDAEVKKYFETSVKKKEDGTDLTASFRGYPLNGHKITLPKEYKGLILHENMRPSTDRDDRKFYVINGFDSFISWNWDKLSRNDPALKVLEWIDIAEALHSPVLEDDEMRNIDGTVKDEDADK